MRVININYVALIYNSMCNKGYQFNLCCTNLQQYVNMCNNGYQCNLCCNKYNSM